MDASPDRSPFPEPPRALPRFLDAGVPSPLRFFAKGTNARGRRGRARVTCEERRGVTHACAIRECRRAAQQAEQNEGPDVGHELMSFHGGMVITVGDEWAEGAGALAGYIRSHVHGGQAGAGRGELIEHRPLGCKR